MRELYFKLIEGVKEVLAEGQLAEFLKFISRFREYSLHNTLLIYRQRPNATMVAGLKTWNSLGRRVKKGEKGIAIFAPTIRKVRVTVEECDPETGEVRLVEREEERVVGFHVTYVFDVSQTEGKPLPEPPEEKKVPGGRAARYIWDRLLKVSPFPVRWGCLIPGAKGEFDPLTGEIHLDPTLEEGMRAKVLLHEVAHGLAYRLGVDGPEVRQKYGGDARARSEAIAEGAAFIAAHHFGLDTSGYSFDYVAGWVRDAEKLLEWGEAVRKVALELIRLIEGAGSEQEAA